MPRTVTLSCADCGKGMTKAKTSRPQGEARCHPCRKARPTIGDYTCGECGRPFQRRANRAHPPKFCGMECVAKANARRMQIRAATDSRVVRGRRENAAPGLRKHAREKLRDRWKRQQKSCAYCPNPADTIDHVVPLVRGGTNYEGNLAPACRRCNSSKSGYTVVEWRSGLRLPGMREAAWPNRPLPQPRKPRPPKVRQTKPCAICSTDTLNRKYCGEACSTEAQARHMRDKYRKQHGLPALGDKPTRPRIPRHTNT